MALAVPCFGHTARKFVTNNKPLKPPKLILKPYKNVKLDPKTLKPNPKTLISTLVAIICNNFNFNVKPVTFILE